MKVKIILFLVLSCTSLAYGQDNSFSFIGKYIDDAALTKLFDSLKMPLLISDHKIYAIGVDCITRDLGGNASGRDDDGDENDRDKNGSNNNREKGGGVGDRDKIGKTGKRDKEGNLLDRNKAGNANKRYLEGKSSLGTRCGVSETGKLLLYTRESMNAKQTRIYYNGKYFSNKHYKIIQV